MRLLLALFVVLMLVGCGAPKDSGSLNWFVWDSEDSENLEYTSLFMEALPSDFDGYNYNKWACNARNGYSLNVLECWFSTGIIDDKGSWDVKIVIEFEPSNDIAREKWQSHADLYYTEEVQQEWLDSQPRALFSDVNRFGDFKYTIHRAYTEGREFHHYQSWFVYESAKIFVMEDNPFTNPVIDDIEGVARNIVNIELGENS